MIDDDGANVHAAAESFFANADVIETLYPGLDTDNYDEAITAAAQDFVLDLNQQETMAMNEFFGSSQPMDIDSVRNGSIHESSSDSEPDEYLSNAADPRNFTIPARFNGPYMPEYFSFIPDDYLP